MKKFILLFIAIMFMSSSFAINNFEAVTDEATEVITSNAELDDNGPGFWFCREVSRTETTNMLTNETTVTITYHCTWYSMSAAD